MTNALEEQQEANIKSRTQRIINHDRTEVAIEDLKKGEGCFPLALLQAYSCLQSSMSIDRKVFELIKSKTSNQAINLPKILQVLNSVGKDLDFKVSNLNIIDAVSSNTETVICQLLNPKDDTIFMKCKQPRTQVDQGEAGLILLANKKTNQAHVLCINGENELLPTQNELGQNLRGGQNEYNIFINDGYMVVASIFLVNSTNASPVI